MGYVEITKKVTFEIAGCSRCKMQRAPIIVGNMGLVVVPDESPTDDLKITMSPDDEADENPSFGWRKDGRHYWSGIVIFPCGHHESFLDEVRRALEAP